MGHPHILVTDPRGFDLKARLKPEILSLFRGARLNTKEIAMDMSGRGLQITEAVVDRILNKAFEEEYQALGATEDSLATKHCLLPTSQV